MRTEFHPHADAEFAAQIEYYETKEAGLGIRFYSEITAHCEWIESNPEIPRLRGTYRRLNLKVFPFYLAYVLEGDLVWVLAVAHVRKRPGYWKRRMKS